MAGCTIPVAVTCVLYIGRTVSRTVLTLPYTFARQLACNNMCTRICKWNHEDWEEVQPRSVTEGCSACCPMEESSLAENVSDKKKRMRTYTTYERIYIPKIPLELTTRLACSRSPITQNTTLPVIYSLKYANIYLCTMARPSQRRQKAKGV